MSACNLSSSKVTANTLGVLVHNEFEASLDYISPCQKKIEWVFWVRYGCIIVVIVYLLLFRLQAWSKNLEFLKFVVGLFDTYIHLILRKFFFLLFIFIFF